MFFRPAISFILAQRSVWYMLDYGVKPKVSVRFLSFFPLSLRLLSIIASVAVKVLDSSRMEEKDIKEFRAEAELMKNLRHHANVRLTNMLLDTLFLTLCAGRTSSWHL